MSTTSAPGPAQNMSSAAAGQSSVTAVGCRLLGSPRFAKRHSYMRRRTLTALYLAFVLAARGESPLPAFIGLFHRRWVGLGPLPPADASVFGLVDLESRLVVLVAQLLESPLGVASRPPAGPKTPHLRCQHRDLTGKPMLAVDQLRPVLAKLRYEPYGQWLG
jgi:hypothetical protein